MRLAPGAWTFGTPPIILGIGLLFVPQARIAGAIVFLLGIGVLLFHRDPERAIGPGIVSPSDGRVAESAAGPAGGFVAAFLNVHNVHVIRAPSAGTVVAVKRLDGPKVPAWAGHANKNAGVELELDTDHGRMRVRMLCGLIARRVVPYVEPGATVEKGERIGLIRFGSRVELVLPSRAHPVVEPGDKVLAGATQVAEVLTE